MQLSRFHKPPIEWSPRKPIIYIVFNRCPVMVGRHCSSGTPQMAWISCSNHNAKRNIKPSCGYFTGLSTKFSVTSTILVKIWSLVDMSVNPLLFSLIHLQFANVIFPWCNIKGRIYISRNAAFLEHNSFCVFSEASWMLRWSLSWLSFLLPHCLQELMKQALLVSYAC